MKKLLKGMLAGIAIVSASIAPSFAQMAGTEPDGCGWDIIFGCTKDASASFRLLAELGGHKVGGGAGTHVLATDYISGFNPGYYCVADGPYVSEGDAGSVAWREAVQEAYVKRGC